MKLDRKLSLTAPNTSGKTAQEAALCFRRKAGKMQVLLITSRDTGRWVLPKGWLMKDCNPGETALCEAWEEAGVSGSLAQEDSIGHYTYPKIFPDGAARDCRVALYAIHVHGLAPKFPEKGQRRRKWMTTSKAAKSVLERDLAKILRLLPKQLAHL
ncbi:NUDIX hydrolase [Thioclava sp. GXIMD4216]|uniref:NUDIX hydrolase n=1 Tax=Thioclava sp. GXIMD4216 TaxID=3131929 RepID=UPI0030D0724D